MPDIMSCKAMNVETGERCKGTWTDLPYVHKSYLNCFEHEMKCRNGKCGGEVVIGDHPATFNDGWCWTDGNGNKARIWMEKII